MPIRFLNGQSNVFAAANPFEVSEYVRANVGSAQPAPAARQRRQRLARPPPRGTLDLCRLSYGAQARVLSGEPRRHLPRPVHPAGYCSYTLANRTLDLPAGHVLVLNPDEPVDLNYSDNCEKFIVHIPSAMLDDACTEHRWFQAQRAHQFSPEPQRFEDIDSLLLLLRLLCEEAESELATPQMLQHYCRVVTTKLMVMLKHNVSMVAPTRHAPSFERLVNPIERNIKPRSQRRGSRPLRRAEPALALPAVREEREDDAEELRAPEEAREGAFDPERPGPGLSERHRSRARVRLLASGPLLRALQVHLRRAALAVDPLPPAPGRTLNAARRPPPGAA